MTWYQFKAHIRTLGEFTNIQAQNLYQRYLSGALTLEQIAINTPSTTALPATFKKVDVTKTVIRKPAFSFKYKRLPAKEYTVLTRNRINKHADQEDQVLLLFKDNSFITNQVVMDELACKRHAAKCLIKRLLGQGAIVSKHSRAGKGFLCFYVLAPVQLERNAP